MGDERFPTTTVAEAYLALLRARGITRLFVNAGTDFAPLAEAYARAEKASLRLPEPIVVPHENVAVGMAHGAYLVTGEPQAVMLHTSVGTANAVMAIMNAARDRVPIVLTAGRTPLFERGALGARDGQIHWAQELFDQAGMLREMVKWDYELRDGLQVETVVDRMLAVAMSEPRGPIYLTLPREVLAAPLEGFRPERSSLSLASDPGPSASAVEEVAELLAGARFPVIVATAAAAKPGTFAALGDLASRFGIGIIEHAPRFVNASSEHPCHLGYGTMSIAGEADLLCVAESDVPWMPTVGEPDPSTTIVHCGIDPLFVRYPIRSHRADLMVTGSSRQLFEALVPALERRRSSIDPGRLERIVAAASERRQRRRAAFEAEATQGTGITKAYLNWALKKVRPPEAIVVDEYWARADRLEPTLEGTEFHNPPIGGLGWAVPAALGVQLASPGRTVVATVGDGAYLFSNPPACHQVMATNGLPVVTVVCNNGRWGAVEASTRLMYPSGFTVEAGSTPLAALDRSHAYELYAIATGGHGERVSERDELVPALERAFEVSSREGRHVVVNVLSDE